MYQSSVIITPEISYNSLEIDTVLEDMEEDINALKVATAQTHLTFDRIKQIILYVLKNAEMVAAVEKALDEEEQLKSGKTSNSCAVEEESTYEKRNASQTISITTSDNTKPQDSASQNNGSSLLSPAEKNLSNKKSNISVTKMHSVSKETHMGLKNSSRDQSELNSCKHSRNNSKSKGFEDCSKESSVIVSAADSSGNVRQSSCSKVTSEDNSKLLAASPTKVKELKKSPARSAIIADDCHSSSHQNLPIDVSCNSPALEMERSQHRKEDRKSKSSDNRKYTVEASDIVPGKRKRSRNTNEIATDTSEAPIKNLRQSDEEKKSDWTRDEDKEILVTCQKFGVNAETFEKISESLSSRSKTEVEERFHELMSLVKKALANRESKNESSLNVSV